MKWQTFAISLAIYIGNEKFFIVKDNIWQYIGKVSPFLGNEMENIGNESPYFVNEMANIGTENHFFGNKMANIGNDIGNEKLFIAKDNFW